jgi:hypothetical protein
VTTLQFVNQLIVKMSYFLTLTPQPPKTHPAKNINVPKNRSCRQTILFTFQVSAIRMCIDWIRQLKEFSKTKVNNQKRWVKSRWFPTVVFPFHTTEINKKLTMQFVLKHCHLASYNLGRVLYKHWGKCSNTNFVRQWRT